MKKTCLLLIGILLIISSNGQVNKLSIGIIGSPDFYNYQFNDAEVTQINYKTSINYSAGLSLHYNLNEFFTAKSGLLFSNKGFMVDWNWQLYTDGIPDPVFPDDSNMKLNYLDIPMLVSYSFLNLEKLSLYASSGLITSILINEKEVSLMQDGTERETEFLKIVYRTEFNPILFNIDFELGLQYDLSNAIFVSFEPYFRYGLNKLSDESTPKSDLVFNILIIRYLIVYLNCFMYLAFIIKRATNVQKIIEIRST